MNTVFLLMAEYETSQIPLEIVAEKFLGIGPAKAKEAARHHRLPFPTYRAGSQKGVQFVHVDDLAKYIDEERKKGQELHAANKIIAA